MGQEAQLSPFAVLRLIYSRPHVIVQPSLGSLLAVISEQDGSTLQWACLAQYSVRQLPQAAFRM